MDEIKKLNSDELRDYIDIAANAFPYLIINTPEEKEKIRQRIIRSADKGFSTGAYGYYQDSRLVGGMRFYDFTMNVFGQRVLFGGIGLVAVDLVHKKEKVANGMILHFLSHYDSKGAFLVGLYAFRPDFYKQMGFGFGSKTKQYQLSPVQLPKGETKRGVCLIKGDEKHLLLDYYQRYMIAHHGCIQPSEFDLDRLYENGDQIIGCKKDGRLGGYIRFCFKKGRDGENYMHVTELLYDDRQILSELLCLLHSQTDQVAKIKLDTNEEFFQFLCENPSNGDSTILLHHQTNVEEVGIMYRVINVRRLFECMNDHDFGGVTAIVKLNIRDSFYIMNNQSFIINFERGHAKIADDEPVQVEIDMDISEFSSMILGVVPFSQLHMYSKAEISDSQYLHLIDSLFYSGQKPICHMKF